MADKRKAEDSNDNSQALVKRQRTDEGTSSSSSSTAIIGYQSGNQTIPVNVQRTSNLKAPIMLLQGHKADVFSVRFSPSGKNLASSSFDKSIFLWRVYGECDNYMALNGHQNAVLEVNWSSDESHIFSASADKTLCVWDSETGRRVRKYAHAAVVNGCGVSKKKEYVVSGSDDGQIKLWDIRSKPVAQVFKNEYSVTSVAMTLDGDQLISGGIDNEIKIWDLRKDSVSLKLEGHTDTITGLRVSPNGNYLLSNSMDNNLIMWDIRPYVSGARIVRYFQGLQHNFEKNLLRCSWAPDGSKISGGSADRFCYVFETATRRILYQLPGHKGSVNDVDFSPNVNEPIIASASSDGTIYLGEIKK